MSKRDEIELLLCCARMEMNPERAARVRELLRRTNLDWEYLQKIALRGGVMPLVYRQLSTNFADAVPAAHLEYLRECFRHNTARNLMRTGELCEILRLLAAGGVDAIAYKGPALALDVYGELSLRQFSDLDVLVRERDVRRATELLSANGYVPEFELSATQQKVFMHSWYVQPFSRGDGIYHLELHWAIAPRFFSFPLETEQLWARARTLKLAGMEALVPGREDLLLLLCVHGAKDLWLRLEWICAVAELVRASVEVDWERLHSRAAALGSERMLLLGLHLAHTLLDVALPESIRHKAEASTQVKALAAQVVENLFAETKTAASFKRQTLFHTRARERMTDKLRYYGRVAVATSPAEWELLPLPQRLFFVYSLVRPVRLCANFIHGKAKRLFPNFRTVEARDSSKQASR